MAFQRTAEWLLPVFALYVVTAISFYSLDNSFDPVCMLFAKIFHFLMWISLIVLIIMAVIISGLWILFVLWGLFEIVDDFFDRL